MNDRFGMERLPGESSGQASKTPVELAHCEDIWRELPTKWLVALWIAAALFNVVSIPLLRVLTDSQLVVVWAGMLFGVLPGEVGALALWLVWGEGSFLRRLVIHFGVGFVLWFCVFMPGMIMFNDYPTIMRWQEVTTSFCLLPLASLAAQAPLWPLRTHFGWRVEWCSANGDAPVAKALSIGDILLGTAMTAVTLSFVRLIPKMAWVGWSGAARMAGVVLVASILFGIPALLLTLRSKELRAGLVILAAYALVVVLILLAVLWGWSGSYVPAFVILHAYIAIYAFAATVISPLIVMRAHGYRLTLPCDRKIA